jgi:hypothetical protein
MRADWHNGLSSTGFSLWILNRIREKTPQAEARAT